MPDFILVVGVLRVILGICGNKIVQVCIVAREETILRKGSHFGLLMRIKGVSKDTPG
jgi:hypothetical protein